MKKLAIPVTILLLTGFAYTSFTAVQISPIIPPYPGNPAVFLNGAAGWTTPAGGGGAPAGTVINTVSSSGLLAVDATKTNGIAATAAHVNSAINGGALTLGGMTFGVGSATLTNAEISGVSDPRTTNEVVLINSGGCNTLALKNMDDTGFSAITFRGKDNQEYGALGYGNTNTTGAPIFSDNVYWQIWGGTTSGAPKRGIITQDGNYGPTGSGFRFYQRQSFELNGDMTFWNLVAYPSQVAVFTVRGTNKTAVVGPIATPRVTLGTGDSQVITLGYAGSPGTYDNEIQGADANAALVLREGPTPRNRNGYYTYGGTLANADGHRFFTGGLRASQTLKFHIADDGVQSTAGLGSKGTGTITTSGTGATNTLGVNVVLYVTAATSAALTDNAGSTEFSGVTIAAFTPIRLQPGGKFTGTSITYATGSASHAW